MSSIIAIIRLLSAFILIIPQIINPLFYIPSMQKSYFEDWSPEMDYTHEYAINIKKDSNKDFVILNLADIQLTNSEQFNSVGKEAFEMIDNLIEEQQPDLITLTGDNAWSAVCYIELVKFIDSLNIPWAPVLGNHDGDGSINDFWCSYICYESENCLFKFGPYDMGYGNYIINITENGKIIHSLYMMDTHSYKNYTTPDGKTYEDYDNLWNNQIEWYEWAVKGTNTLVGRTVESTVFLHIPVYEMKEVYESNYDRVNDKFTDVYAKGSFGVIHEIPCPGAENNGFFDLVKELGSTKNIIFGHDHINSGSVVIDGVRLTYGLKLGKGCYYEQGMMGGTIITINSYGKATVEHQYCA